MLIERSIEEKVVTAIKAALPTAWVGASRRVAPAGTVRADDAVSEAVSVIVRSGIRAADAFSLSTVNILVAVEVVGRVGLDPTGGEYEAAVEAVVGIIDAWHRDGAAMTAALSSSDFFAAELRIDGGSGEMYDEDALAWRETISFTVRGKTAALDNNE